MKESERVSLHVARLADLDVKLKFQATVERIRSEEEKQSTKRGGDDGDSENAFYSGMKGKKFTLRCFTCNKVGHMKFDCPQNRGKKKCVCHKVGHTSMECSVGNKEHESADYAGSYASESEDDD